MRYARRRARSAFETLPSTGKPRCLSAMINAKSLKNRGNASEKLPARKVTEKKNTIAVDEDVAGFRTVFFPPPSVPRSSQMLCLARIMRPFSHEEIAFTATSSRSSGFLAAIQNVCACVCVCVRAIGVLTQLNIVPLFLDLTQGDSASCHTFLLV